MPTIFTNTLEHFEPRARALMEIHPQDDGTDDDNLNSKVPLKGEEVWTIREVANGEEQLYAKDKCVYWTRNSLIIKSFNFTDHVVRVFWTRFDRCDHVCVALTSGLSIFDNIGRHHQLLLPFAYREMHSTSLGILIERNSSFFEDTSLPVFFALTHPTREISPVLLKPQPPNLTSVNLIQCHSSIPYCLMYNAHDMQHSIWYLRQTTPDELDIDETANTFANHQSRTEGISHLAASRLGAGCDINATNIKSFNSAHTFNSIATPNKNKITNYLRDTIEEPILPELTLEQVWVDPSESPAKASRFFTMQDLIGQEYVVIVIPASNQIKVMQQCSDSESLVLSRPVLLTAIDAAPIYSMKMMIVLEVNKNFILYSGVDRVTQIQSPQPAPSNLLPSSSPMSPMRSSARKRTSLGGRSSVGSDISFQQIFSTLSPVPHAGKHESKSSSPICSADAKQIEHVIGQSVFVLGAANQRARMEIPTVCQTTYVHKLLHAMKLLVSKDLGLIIISKWYNLRRSLVQPELMRAQDELNLFKFWFIDCMGLERNPFDSGYSLMPSKKSRRNREPESQMIANSHTLFYAMHLAFEDLIVMKLNYNIAASLAELLLVLAHALKLEKYQDYYWRKFPYLQQKFGPELRQQPLPNVPQTPLLFCDRPASVIGFIDKLITLSQFEQIDINDEPINKYPVIKGATNHAHTVISIFCEMFGIDSQDATQSLTSKTKETLGNLKLSKRPVRSKRADQKVVELMVKLGKDRNYLSRLPEALNLYIWDALLNSRESPPTDWSEECFELVGRMDLVHLVTGRARQLDPRSDQSEKEDETLKLLFPDDIRVSEAHRMVASDSPIEFSIVQKQGATEEEHRDDAHRHLYLLNIRTMAMPVGRGAICLRTYSPVIGESFEVPRLDLSGRALTEDRPIEYNHDISVYPWPFFHNGVAAGLTMCASSANNIIDSTWINYNRPRSNIAHGADMRDRDLTTANTNNEHAGFLFALGLNGHLEKLSLMALHDYLCQNNDLTKLAILLGMSAAKRGSRDTNIIKVLSIHVDALLPPNSTELDVPAPVHSASIIGVGLLFQGSGDSHISRVLLEEIGRLPGPETNSHVDRESYSLSAGLAFGLVNLCKGGSTTISSSEQLRLYMLGGKRKPLTASQKERYFKQDCHRGEEEYINTHITGPGGTLGLGLMYHRSGNESVANWMRAPDTQTLLEYVRPDFLILRMLSYGLIMWDEVDPTEKYIDSQMPKIVTKNAFCRDLSSQTDSDGLTTNSGTTIAIDYELISQAYCNIIAGCCMAIAMKYAGTADARASKTIYENTKMLIMLINKPALAEQAGRPCIESCLSVMITSLAVVMSGTGDLGTMRLCRYLRSRLTHSCVFYGSYMATHMALGILFLGSCRYSLSTSPESIGALVCALYPIYPNHSSDNRYHLQALRHLYVLAAEPRLLIPRDILTNKPVYVNITVEVVQGKDGTPKQLKLKAPCLMPEVETIERVSVDDPRYWRIEINDKKVLMRCLAQGHGYLSVKQKAHSSNNQLVQNIETYILKNVTMGVMKCRKSAALSACVKEDRVEQYSALNDLLTKSAKVDPEFKCLMLEQLRLATTLTKEGRSANKINQLKPLVGEFESELRKQNAEEKWIDYITKKTDWTNTQECVAQLIALNDLKYEAEPEDDVMQHLVELSFK